MKHAAQINVQDTIKNYNLIKVRQQHCEALVADLSEWCANSRSAIVHHWERSLLANEMRVKFYKYYNAARMKAPNWGLH